MAVEANADQAKLTWVADVRQIVGDIREWAEKQNWLVHEHEKPLLEARYGAYALPQLFIRTPQHQKLVIDPVALDIVGAEGRIDIEAFPSLHRFILVRHRGAWRLKTDAMIDWPKPWGEDTFLGIVQALAEAA